MPEVKERPILFSGPMVRAILGGQKTVTRRQVSAKLASQFDEPRGQADIEAGYPFVECHNGFQPATEFCPYGRPGDRLWVREAWAQINVAQAPGDSWVVYRECDNRTDYGGPWKPSIHMRRRDSRILLEITDVRVERLQDITPDQAIAEGVDADMCRQYLETSPSRHELKATEIHGFAGLWQSTGGDWDANPWVWVVEFKRVTP